MRFVVAILTSFPEITEPAGPFGSLTMKFFASAIGAAAGALGAGALDDAFVFRVDWDDVEDVFLSSAWGVFVFEEA